MATDNIGLMNDARKLFDNLNYKEAEKIYRKILEQVENYPEAWNGLGKSLFEQKEYKKAIEAFEKFISLKGDDASAYNDMGRCYFLLKQWNKAIEYYELACKKDPGEKVYFSNLGNALFEEKEYKKAIEAFAKCTSLKDNNASAYNNLGRCYFQLEQWNKAIEYYQLACKKDPSEKVYLCNVGLALTVVGEYDKAREFVEKAIELDKNYEDAWRNLAALERKQGNLAASTKLLRECITLNPGFFDASNELSYDLINNYEYEEAKQFIQECRQKFSDKIFFILSEAFWFQQTGDLDKAIKLYEEAIAKDPANPVVYYSLAYCFAEQGNYVKSIENYNRSISLGFESSWPIINKSNNLGNMFRYNECINCFNEVKNTSPEYIYAQHNIAFYYEKMGRYAEAKEKWECTFKLYEEKLRNDKRFSGDFINYLYYGESIFVTMQDFQKGYDNLKKFVEKNAVDLYGLSALNSLLSEKIKLAIEKTPTDYWEMKQNLSKAEDFLNGKKDEYRSYNDLIAMANLYFLDSNYKSAIDFFEKAKVKRPHLAVPVSGISSVHYTMEQYKEAIDYFVQAKSLEPYDLSNRVKLARSYLKNNNPDKAELELREVMAISENHVDAHIAFGEMYLNMAENMDPEFYDLAESSFTKALQFGKTRKGSRQLNLQEPKTNRKREYKDADYSDLLQLRGYTRTKIFEASTNKLDQQMLVNAQADFTEALRANPDNHKALRSKEKLRKILNRTKFEKWIGRAAPWIVAAIAFVVFIICQYFFYIQPELQASKQYQLSAPLVSFIASLDSVAGSKTKSMAAIRFKSRDEVVSAVKHRVSEKVYSEVEPMLSEINLQNIEKPQPVISEGYYVLITFGSILFLITGFFLPQLLKLKVGAIEMEKSTVDMSVVTSIGLKRD